MEEKLLFGKYRFLKTLANGNGGTVFLVQHDTLGEKRVIKKLCKNYPYYAEQKKEAQILKRLHHAAIPEVYDLEEDEEALYIIEQNMEGESLRDILFRKKCIPSAFIIFYSLQLCDIIEYLHGQGILYLDLKPDNIILNQDRVALIDFGGAHRTGEPQTVSFGTGEFAAPEQYTCEAEERTDVYGIGRIIGTMLGNGLQSDNEQERRLQRIYAKCVQTLPARRYRSVAELREELKYFDRNGKKSRAGKKRRKESQHCIGVVGAHEGAATAAFSILAAGYLAEHGSRVACVNLSGKEVFRALYESLHGKKEASIDRFTYYGVCYRENATKNVVEEMLAEGFQTVVVHFGIRADEDVREYLHCEQKFVVGDAFPWNIKAWEGLSARLFGLRLHEAVTALVTGGEKEELPLKFHKIRELPRMDRIVHPDKKTERFLEKLLKEGQE